MPLGATLPGSAERKPSEIPSKTRSVSAFLLGRVSVGPRSSGKVASGSLTPPCLSLGEEWVEKRMGVGWIELPPRSRDMGQAIQLAKAES